MNFVFDVILIYIESFYDEVFKLGIQIWIETLTCIVVVVLVVDFMQLITLALLRTLSALSKFAV